MKEKTNKKINLKTIGLIILIIISIVSISINIFNFVRIQEKNTIIIYKGDKIDKYKEDGKPKKDKVAFTIEVDNKNAEVLELNNNYLLYKDNKIKLYDIKNKSIKELSLNENYTMYQMALADDKIIGIIYKNESPTYIFNNEGKINESKEKQTKIGFYNIETKNVLHDGIYSQLQSLNNEYYLEGKINNETYLLNVYNYEPAIKSRYEKASFSIEEDYIIEHNNIYGNSRYANQTIYTKDAKEIITVANDQHYSIYNNKLYAIANNVVKEYDKNGNFVNTSKEYEKIMQVAAGYIIYLKDSKLYITDEKDINLELTEFKENYIYTKYSNYYHYTEFVHGKEGDSKIHIVVVYKDENDICQTINTTFKIDTKEVNTTTDSKTPNMCE